MDITIKRVLTTNQVDAVVRLANIIWPEHYSPIIGKDQVEYMLRTFHSSQSIANEVNNKHYQYYLILRDDKPVGYIGIKLEKESLFLSKIYVLAENRGHGLGKKAIEFLRELTSSNQLGKITLTVNKHNLNSISAYQSVGFQITGKVCTDIGEGYVMDDYQMELEL